MRHDSGLWQLFTGFEIDCPRHGYAQDTVRLMDFQSASETISFVYLLPLGPDRLLVEWTEFLPLWQEPDYDEQINAWLKRNLHRPFSVTRRESGALPMMEIANPLPPGRVINAGIRGGWMRPSSGFHFSACQRGCQLLAAQILAAHRSGQWIMESPQLRHRGLRWMDRVFLKALRRQPDQAPAWFIALFAGTSAAQMSRFMSDKAHLSDILAVIRALPPGPLIKAALHR
jgi:lycopene beta-cyclase